MFMMNDYEKLRIKALLVFLRDSSKGTCQFLIVYDWLKPSAAAALNGFLQANDTMQGH